MSQDSSATPVAGLGSPLMTRWDPAQIERADALAKATGLPRSVIIRAAFDHGIALVEQSVAALAGVATGTGEPV